MVYPMLLVKYISLLEQSYGLTAIPLILIDASLPYEIAHLFTIVINLTSRSRTNTLA
jgi:hypothetical protein